MSRTRAQEDHIDRWLRKYGDKIPVDLETEAIVDRIAGISRRLHRTMEETLADFELTYGEYGVLSQLQWRERATPGELAKKDDLSSGAMTNRLDRLEEAGLIRRVPDPDDRRSTLIELTKKGDELWKRAVAVQGEKEALIASALNEREKKQLNALLRRMMVVFEENEK